jgi:hypothetical protein
MSTDTIGGPGGRGAEKSRAIQLGRAMLRGPFGRLVLEFQNDAMVEMLKARCFRRNDASRLVNTEAHVANFVR